MRRTFSILLTAILLTSASVIKASETQCDNACMLSGAESYFNALDKVAKKNSTSKDIEALLALMHPSIKYEHIEYGANFDLESWRKAFNRQLKLGRYDNGPENQIRIIKTIYGKSHIAVEYSHGLLQQDGTWQSDQKMFALFGFTDGKVSLIREYW